MSEITPTIEEVRRHWGLAVDIHRREERLAQFDRMIKSHVSSVIGDQDVDTYETPFGEVYISLEDLLKLLNGIVENV